MDLETRDDMQEVALALSGRGTIRVDLIAGVDEVIGTYYAKVSRGFDVSHLIFDPANPNHPTDEYIHAVNLLGDQAPDEYIELLEGGDVGYMYYDLGGNYLGDFID